MRFLALDFETNGKPNDRLRPCGAFPTQVSVDAFVPETNEVVHLYDSFIHGAEDLSDWVLANTPVTHDLLEVAPWAAEVSLALADLWREGDIIVCHNATFDLGAALPRSRGGSTRSARRPSSARCASPGPERRPASNPSSPSCVQFWVCLPTPTKPTMQPTTLTSWPIASKRHTSGARPGASECPYPLDQARRNSAVRRAAIA